MGSALNVREGVAIHRRNLGGGLPEPRAGRADAVGLENGVEVAEPEGRAVALERRQGDQCASFLLHFGGGGRRRGSVARLLLMLHC